MRNFLIIPVVFLVLVSPAFAGPKTHSKSAKATVATTVPLQNPDEVLLKLRDSDPAVRAQQVALAANAGKLDYRIIESLARLMNNLSEEPTTRLGAACAVGANDSAYSLDGARRAADLIDQLGYPAASVAPAKAAIVRQGDAIISDLENAHVNGRLSERFYVSCLQAINTPAARFALENNSALKLQAPRHNFKR